MNREEPLSTLTACYPHLTPSAIFHAIKAVEGGKLPSGFLGNYLNHLNEYFCCRGDMTVEGYGLIPKDGQAFFEKKLNAWLDFWSI